MAYRLTWQYGSATALDSETDERTYPNLDALRDHLILAGLTIPERLDLIGTGRAKITTPGFAPEYYTLTEV